MERILVIDDEKNMCLALERQFRRLGFQVRYGFDGDDLYRIAAHWEPHLVVLDVMLAHEDGRDLARRFRAMYDTPILMLTGQINVNDRISGLDSGADDYLCKPFVPGELVARVRALLRRAALRSVRLEDAEQPVMVDRDRRMLVAPSGAEEKITELQANIMSALLERPGQVISREDLYSLVFLRPWIPGDRSLDMHVSNLRKALARLEPKRIHIQSIRNVGYRLVINPD